MIVCISFILQCISGSIEYRYVEAVHMDRTLEYAVFVLCEHVSKRTCNSMCMDLWQNH